MEKAVLFDLDGTLWHTCDVILPVWNDILKKHKETTKQITLEEMNSYMGKTVEQIASIMLPELTLENSVAIVKECCAEQIPSLRKTGGHLYDNLESTLEILSKNYFLSISSAASDVYKRQKYFSDFEMSGRTNLTKGENIKLVMERNGINNALYLGDTIGDQIAAKGAEIPFVFASYGFGTTENPEYTISSFDELPKVAEKILG